MSVSHDVVYCICFKGNPTIYKIIATSSYIMNNDYGDEAAGKKSKQCVRIVTIDDYLMLLSMWSQYEFV